MNLPASILNKMGRNLHNVSNHPIEILKRHIYEYFDKLSRYNFNKFDGLNPIVSIEDNFDKLLIPSDHPARSKSDTYYVDDKTVLRTPTSAHQNQLLLQGFRSFLVTGDVYRKDEIDRLPYFSSNGRSVNSPRLNRS
jgi:phenylalanyl-tRNA synthetase alpha chain